MQAEVILKMSPTELEIHRRALYAYEQVLKIAPELPVTHILRRVGEAYGTLLERSLPGELREAVKKVRISLR